MTNFLLKTKEIYNDLNKTEQKIASFVMKNTDDILNYPIAELARRSDVSQAAWVRFCKTMGFSGLKELKKEMIAEINAPTFTVSSQRDRDCSGSRDINSIGEQILTANVQSIEDTMKVIDLKNVEIAAEEISKAKRLCFYGEGSAAIVAADANYKFLELGKYSIAPADVQLQLSTAATLTNDDVMVVISYTGMAKEMVDVLKVAKKTNAKTISITKYGKNQVSHEADINLFISAPEIGNLKGATGTRIAQLTVIDLLYACVLSKTVDESAGSSDEQKA